MLQVLVKPHHEQDILDIKRGKAKLRPSGNIKDILQMQLGLNCLLFHKGIMLLMLPMTYKSFNRLLLMYINTLLA